MALVLLGRLGYKLCPAPVLICKRSTALFVLMIRLERSTGPAILLLDSSQFTVTSPSHLSTVGALITAEYLFSTAPLSPLLPLTNGLPCIHKSRGISAISLLTASTWDCTLSASYLLIFLHCFNVSLLYFAILFSNIP